MARLLPITLSLLLIGLGCGKPVNGSKENVPPPIPAKSPDEILVKKISEEPLIKPEEKGRKAVRFDRKDPNQLRIGSTIDAVLRKRKNNAKAGQNHEQRLRTINPIQVSLQSIYIIHIGC